MGVGGGGSYSAGVVVNTEDPASGLRREWKVREPERLRRASVASHGPICISGCDSGRVPGRARVG